jgi:hypothetical protein
MLGLPADRLGPLPGFRVRQARSAQASPEASIARYGLLHSVRILTENGAAAAGDAAREVKLVVKRPKKITFALRPGHSVEARCDRLVDAYLRMLDIGSSAKALQPRTAGSLRVWDQRRAQPHPQGQRNILRAAYSGSLHVWESECRQAYKNSGLHGRGSEESEHGRGIDCIDGSP